MVAPVVPIVFVGLFIWSLYRRVRRNIGRQPLRPQRIIVSLVIFALLTVFISCTSFQFPNLLLGMGGGLLAGALLGFVGLKLTKFETTAAGHFYTPNTFIGLGLTALFIGRMLYRFWILSDTMKAANHPQLFQSPLTLLCFGLIAGYYLVYYIGLFVHTHDKK